MTSRKSLAMFILATVCLASCGKDRKPNGDDTGGETGQASVEQSTECQAYLDCILAVSPDSVGELMDSYGPEGACWDSQEAADLCTEACVEAMAQWLEQYPTEDECRLGEGGSAEVLGVESKWQWSVDACTGDSYKFLEVHYGTVIHGGDDALAFELDVTTDDWMTDLESTTCELLGEDFACEPLVTDFMGVGDCSLVLEGTFENDFTTGIGRTYCTEGNSTQFDCRDVLGERVQ